MSDEIRNPKSNPLPPTTEPWSVEQDADLLMNDLFANVDGLLEGTTHFSHHIVTQEPGRVDAVTVAAAESQDAAISPSPAPQRALQKRSAQKYARNQSMTWSTRLLAWQTRMMPHLDKVCFGIACLFMSGAVLWVINQNRRMTSEMSSVGNDLTRSTTADSLAIHPEDAQFAQYMLRSLQVINRQDPQVPVSRSSQDNLNNTRLGETSTQTNPQVIERVYIPVYPPNATADSVSTQPGDRLASASPNVSQSSRRTQSPTLPTVPLPTLSNVPRLNVPERSQPERNRSGARQPEQSQSASNAPEREAVEQSAVRSPASLPRLDGLPITGVPVLPQVPSNSPNPTRPQIPTSPEASPLPTEGHKLVGIVESGGRATAMFEVGEITQQIGLGEAIGGSGWTLVSTNDQSATIRKNGEVRSVYLGQSF